MERVQTIVHEVPNMANVSLTIYYRGLLPATNGSVIVVYMYFVADRSQLRALCLQKGHIILYFWLKTPQTVSFGQLSFLVSAKRIRLLSLVFMGCGQLVCASMTLCPLDNNLGS